MKRECYLCHKIIEDEMITKCPACQSEILFPIKEQVGIIPEYETPSVKIVIGGDNNKEKRNFNVPKISLPNFKSWIEKNKSIPVVTPTGSQDATQLNIEIGKLHKRFDVLENIISKIPLSNSSEYRTPISNILDIEEIIEHQITTQMLIIILIIMVFLLFIVLLI